MRTDFEAIADGQRVKLFPNHANPWHRQPVIATHDGGYYFCEGSNPADGPDYYFRDVVMYNSGFELVASKATSP